MPHEIVMINVTGADKPGVTSALTAILSTGEATVLDVGQATIHENLALSFLVAFPEGQDSSPVFKELLFKAHALGLNVRFTPVSVDEYERWVLAQGKPRNIVTLLGPSLTAEHISRISGIIASHGLNIDVITRLSGRISVLTPPERPRACVEFSVRGEPADTNAMRAQFLAASHELCVDISFQEDNVFRRNRRMVCFDMDSTLIQAEVIDELAKAYGVGDEVSRVTLAAMKGELDFRESLRRRLRLLKGLDVSVMEAIHDRLPLTDGAERLTRTLKQIGYKTAILSGGFTYFGRKLQERLGTDYMYANELEIRDGRLTGEVVGEIVDGQRKAALLKQLAEQEGISLQQVIAVGDGANDLPMLNLAGLGIAFQAKPLVKEKAGHAINTVGLDGILYLIGVRDRDLELAR